MAQLVKIADAEALDDLTASALVRTTASDFHGAIVELLTDLLGDAIADEPSLQAAIESAAVTAMSDAAVQAQLAWVKGSVGVGTDYNNLTASSGYFFRTSSTSSMPNRPPFSWATGPTVVETVVLSTDHILQRARSITVDGSMPSAERQRFNGVWSEWKDTTAGQQQIPSATNLATFRQLGDFYARSSSVVAGITDLPNGSDGNPFLLTVRLLSDANLIWEQEFTQVTVGNSAVNRWRRTAHGEFGDWIRDDSVRWFDRRNLNGFAGALRFWGDSLVGSSGLPEALNALVTETVINHGRGGDTSNEILLRAGIINLYLTPAGGSIPASGAVVMSAGAARLGMREGRAFTCTIAGVPGTLTHVADESYSFTRTTAGTAVAVAAPTPVWVTPGHPKASDVHLFLMGENDVWWNPTNRPPDADLDDHLVSVYQRAVDAVAASRGEKHVLIGGIKTTQSTVPGDARDLLVQDVNGRLKALFPAYFVDRQKWLATDALAAAGITPTQADLAAMAAGLVPPSAFSDDLHIKTEVVAAEAPALWLPALAVRGWVTQL